ncbi:MAG: hypothetical protein QOI53_1175, partial [Verrucomicrobiota bacterium]|nr:hypothetical protein [Verrucomicrobiota bacterium]
ETKGSDPIKEAGYQIAEEPKDFLAKALSGQNRHNKIGELAVRGVAREKRSFFFWGAIRQRWLISTLPEKQGVTNRKVRGRHLLLHGPALASRRCPR